MIAQGSEEWFAARIGRVTASRIADLRAKTKTGWGASRANYAAQLVIERLTGAVAESHTNAAMQWGVDHEADACAAYAWETNLEPEECGFIEHPRLFAGASPDRLIGTDGLLEVKCPNSSTHLDTLLGGTVPDRYRQQVQFQLACTGRQWADFCSFDPRLPPHLRLWVRRVERDEGEIVAIERDVAEFLVELDARLDALNKLAGTGVGDKPPLLAA